MVGPHQRTDTRKQIDKEEIGDKRQQCDVAQTKFSREGHKNEQSSKASSYREFWVVHLVVV
jgi:hypothetical protein